MYVGVMGRKGSEQRKREAGRGMCLRLGSKNREVSEGRMVGVGNKRKKRKQDRVRKR